MYSKNDRALPPAEHHVVVAWYETEEQLAWTKRTGIANVRLGRRRGTWHIPPEVASARHLLLRTHRDVVVPGLWRLKVPGYKVFTADDLLQTGYPGAASGQIYAVFEVEEDPDWQNCDWDGRRLMDLLEEHEAKRKHRPLKPLGVRSAILGFSVCEIC